MPLTPFPRPRTERELSALGTPFFLFMIPTYVKLFLSHPVDSGAIPSADVCTEDDFDKRFQDDLDEAMRQSLGTLFIMSASFLYEYARILGS